MALCPIGQKPTIEWQYSSEEKQQIIGADNYAVEQEKGKCPVLYHAYGTYGSKNASNCNQLAYWKNAEELIGTNVISYKPQIVSNHWMIPLSNGNYARIRPLNKALYDSRSYGYSSASIVYGAPSIECVNSTSYNGGFSVSLVSVIRQDGLPDNCGDCVFKVTKNGTVVYQKSTPVCPTVTVICGDQCPPGTCQCDCGNYVCCYDTATGKAVKSFRK
jgi:hypothetical protein